MIDEDLFSTCSSACQDLLPPNATLYDRFQLGIGDRDLYPEGDPRVARILSGMANARFASIEQKEGGTQFKLVVELADGGEALFKPMRFPREQVRTLSRRRSFVAL